MQQLLGGVVAHLLLTVVHSGALDDDGQVTAGGDGDGDAGYIDAQDVDGLALQTHTVVVLALLPGLHLDDHIDLLGILDRADTVHAAHVDDADAAQLDEVADVVGGGAHQGLGGHAANLHRVVGDETVTALNQLHSGLALTDAAVAHQQHAFAVHLHQHTVTGDAGGQLDVEVGNQGGHQGGGGLLAHQQGHVMGLAGGQQFGQDGQVAAQNHRRRIGAHQLVEMALP